MKIDPNCDATKLKAGDRLSRLSYLSVESIGNGFATVKNETGKVWTIDLSLIAAECFSASEVRSTEVMTRTQLVQKFNELGNAIFTVNFNKQPKVEDAFEAIANRGKLLSNREMNKALATEMKGEERTLIGYIVSRDIALGRSMVVDLEQKGDDRIRLVDHRTLNWFICANVRYEVKK